jgi:hypothetical protein
VNREVLAQNSSIRTRAPRIIANEFTLGSEVSNARLVANGHVGLIELSTPAIEARRRGLLVRKTLIQALAQSEKGTIFAQSARKALIYAKTAQSPHTPGA